jgi:hypothetical protein
MIFYSGLNLPKASQGLPSRTKRCNLISSFDLDQSMVSFVLGPYAPKCDRMKSRIGRLTPFMAGLKFDGRRDLTKIKEQTGGTDKLAQECD